MENGLVVIEAVHTIEAVSATLLLTYKINKKGARYC